MECSETIIQVPGKLILSGEFACVWGHPVIATPLPLYLTIKVQQVEGVRSIMFEAGDQSRDAGEHMHIEERTVLANELEEVCQLFWLLARQFKLVSRLENKAARVVMQNNIPLRMGLGSSAAVIVGVTKVLFLLAGAPLPPKLELFPVLKDIEDRYHQKSSGIDLLTVLEDRPVCLRLANGKIERIKDELDFNGGVLLMVSSHQEKNTRESIAILQARMAKNTDGADKLREISEITLGILRAVEEKKWDCELQSLLTRNQDILGELGLSHPNIDRIVAVFKRHGLGAKLTGGGRGGFVISLLERGQFALIQRALEADLQKEGFLLSFFEF